MRFAIRTDGQGWRSVASANDVGEGEYFSETLPVPSPEQLLSDEQSATVQRIQAARDAAIGQTVSSGALGALHQYNAKMDNIQFLNGLVTLGNGGKFTCTDADGVKARRLHSHLQLLALAGDIEAHVSAQFDRYELKLAEIAAAQTPAELTAISW